MLVNLLYINNIISDQNMKKRTLRCSPYLYLNLGHTKLIACFTDLLAQVFGPEDGVKEEKE